MNASSNQSSGLVWDHAGMLERIGFDKDIASALVDGFLSSMPAQIEIMERLLDQADLGGISQVAHGLKGVAAAVGGDRLRQSAEQVEHLTKNGNSEELSNAIHQLKTDFQALYTALEQSEYGDIGG